LAAAAAIVGLIVLTISLAAAFARLIRFWTSKAAGAVTVGSLVVTVVLCAVLIWVTPKPASAIIAYFVVGQLAIAGLLNARNPLRTNARVEHSTAISTMNLDR
jgi:hypothetical protein